MPAQVTLVRSRDRHIITPAEIEADDIAGGGLNTDAERQARSDVVSGWLVGLYQGREPWRNTYSEQMGQIDGDGERLRPSRWPLEEVPEIWLGGAPLDPGMYRIAGDCRHFLLREPHWQPCSPGDYRIPSYVAGYVPPGSIIDAWASATGYAPGESTSLGDATGSWAQSQDPAGQLLFECASAGTSDAAEPSWPLSLAEWAPGFAYSDRWVKPLSSRLVFEPTTPGVSAAGEDAEEPDWPDTAGETVDDGTATWTARTEMSITDGTVIWVGRNAKPFPQPIRMAALLLARLVATLHRAGAGECDKKEEHMRAITNLLEGAC